MAAVVTVPIMPRINTKIPIRAPTGTTRGFDSTGLRLQAQRQRKETRNPRMAMPNAENTASLTGSAADKIGSGAAQICMHVS
eukprot:m.3027 g.3027  ORF g.3027 m.3027 type:complete len:82 (-) comp2026_c0_seq1:506-751(-)